MSVGFGDDFKELVRANTNLVDVVSDYVALTPRGGNDYAGLCPFHEDKNPSFHVYADRQSYRCWVCEKGGDCFGFLMEHDKLTFPEALEILAQRANLEIPKRQKSEFSQKSAESKVTQYEIVEWALNLMQQAFRLGDAGEVARKYANERSLSDETLRSFRVGYHPFDWSWLLSKARGKYSEKQLVSVGLAGERDNGQGYYDNLVDRLIFPIIDERGRPVAFGGRVLPEGNIKSDAKYWNSPESSIFLKRRTLYGFDQARKGIKDDEAAVVVEGYMDVVACHQAGATNVVATLGTALTEDHVKILKRFTNRVVLFYDGDTAGQRAAEKSITRFLAQDLDLRILSLGDGQDPSDYFETHDKSDFQNLVKNAPEAWEYKLQMLLARHGVDTVSGRQQVMNEMIEFLAAAPGLQGTMREDLILKNVCHRVQADELSARRQLKETRDKGKKKPFGREDGPSEPQPTQKSFRAFDLAERELLEIILSEPKTTEYIRYQIGPDDFENHQHRRLLELCFDLLAEEGHLPEPQRVIAAAESNSELLSLINALLDSASEKGISSLMNQQPLDHQEGDGAFVPPHLERVLSPLILRRDRNQNIVSKQKMAQTSASSSELPNDTMDALRRITMNIEKKPGNAAADYKKHR